MFPSVPVLERKISMRQSREELIRRGVLIPDQGEPGHGEVPQQGGDMPPPAKGVLKVQRRASGVLRALSFLGGCLCVAFW